MTGTPITFNHIGYKNMDPQMREFAIHYELLESIIGHVAHAGSTLVPKNVIIEVDIEAHYIVLQISSIFIQ